MSVESNLGGRRPGLKRRAARFARRAARLERRAARLARRAVATALAGAALPTGVGAQTAVPESPESAADSIAALEAARGAQAAFERLRVAHLRWARPEPRAECDERVGRFCWWHGEGDDDWRPPPEPEAVRAGRERLLERLAEAAERIPGDDWIVGQRVRYLVEAGRTGAARALARRSASGPGWRAALEGYALHAEGAYPAAEAAFDRALAALPDSTRRAWTDVGLLLEAGPRRIYAGLGPGARAAFERRLWWASDPMWSVPGNERRSEHLARWVTDRLESRARSPWGVRWGADLRELLLRYGAPVGWERVRPDAGALGGGGPPGVVGHDPPGGRRTVPAWEALGGPTVAGPGAWSVEAESPRSTYAPGYASRLVDLDGQVAAFRRGGRIAVVAAWSLEADTVPPGEAVEAALVVSAGPDDPPAIARGRFRGPDGALRIDAPERPAVASVEAIGGEARVAGRLRGGLRLPDRMSGLLLVGPGPEVPSTLEAAIGEARPAPEARPGERVGVYAELYPPAGAREARIEVRVRGTERGGLRRAIARILGRGEAASTAALAWVEPLDGAPARPLAFTLRWPDLPDGPYALEVEVGWPDGRRSIATRTVAAGR